LAKNLVRVQYRKKVHETSNICVLDEGKDGWRRGNNRVHKTQYSYIYVEIETIEGIN